MHGVLDTVTGSAALDEIGTMLDRMWSVYDHVPWAVRTQVGIAVGEIGANIIEHAAQGTPVRLRFEVLVLPDEVRAFFTDHGSPARLDLNIAVAMPDHLAESGRGLAIAQAVLDRLSYIRGWANHWFLAKRFS